MGLYITRCVKASWRRHLREHIRVTYLDRQIYWNLRFASRGFNDVLVIIIDSMDKTKFAWPRYASGRRPHDLADLCRPRISFTIAMAHGYCVDMYAAPEELNHGADAFLEVLCRTIDHVQKICQQRNLPFPRHLVIQSDNTVAQAKNQYVAVFLAFLVSRRLFLSVNLFFLVVGHTHEDIGISWSNNVSSRKLIKKLKYESSCGRVLHISIFPRPVVRCDRRSHFAARRLRDHPGVDGALVVKVAGKVCCQAGGRDPDVPECN